MILMALQWYSPGSMIRVPLNRGLEPKPEPVRRNNVAGSRARCGLEPEVSMRSAAILLGTMLAGAVGLTAACSQPQATAPTMVRTAATSCPAAPASPAGTTLTIKNADNGRILCAAVGERVLVFLAGTMAHKWSPIKADSAALAPAASGDLALRVGVTGASFMAAHPGSARISSAKLGCKHSAATGCGMSMTFHATVVVSRLSQE
jgi:hypothetical protein